MKSVLLALVSSPVTILVAGSSSAIAMVFLGQYVPAAIMALATEYLFLMNK